MGDSAVTCDTSSRQNFYHQIHFTNSIKLYAAWRKASHTWHNCTLSQIHSQLIPNPARFNRKQDKNSIKKFKVYIFLRTQPSDCRCDVVVVLDVGLEHRAFDADKMRRERNNRNERKRERKQKKNTTKLNKQRQSFIQLDGNRFQ